MLVKTYCAAVNGLDVTTVTIEVSLCTGVMYKFTGLGDTAVREGRDRIAAALQHIGYKFPHGDITVNMAPADLYLVTPITKGKKKTIVTQLTQENKHILDQLAKGSVEQRWVKTTDGKDMMYWVILPPHFDATKKYPTLLFCEGGPQSPVSQFWSYRWNFMIMASHGYVIVAPNRHGLPGFGSEWCEEISGDWTGQCMDDYLTAIDDATANLPYVDKNRLGAVGASFGGFSVYYLAGHHDKRFKCFIAHDGAFNLEAMYTETEENWFSNWEYDVHSR